MCVHTVTQHVSYQHPPYAQMVNEKAQLGAIASALADLNEMRLSKFEYALFTTKLMEVAATKADILDVASYIIQHR